MPHLLTGLLGVGFDRSAFAVVFNLEGFVLAELEQFHVLHTLADFLLDFGAEFRIVLQEEARVLAALADALVVVAEPRAALLDDIKFGGEVEDGGFTGNAATIENVEFALGERSRNLVLHDLHAGTVTDDLFAVLDCSDAADVDTLRGVELEGVAAGSGFGVAEHHADLHAELVDEQHAGIGLRKDAGELAEGLAHEAGLQSDVVVAHFAVDFGLRHKCCHRVNHDDIDGAGTDEGLGDVEGLLARIGLGNEEGFDIDTELAGIDRVEGVFGIDEGCDTAELLGFGNGMQGERRLAGGFGAVDFDDAAAGETSNAERWPRAMMEPLP